MTEQFRSRDVDKIYWAVVPGLVVPEQGRWVDWLRKDERHRKVKICRPGNPDGQEAVLEYTTLCHFGDLTLLQIQLLTGRKHQIRVQLAHRDHPILGDRKYSSDRSFPRGIALHARRLAFEHPVKRETIEIVADLPASWDHLQIRDIA